MSMSALQTPWRAFPSARRTSATAVIAMSLFAAGALMVLSAGSANSEDTTTSVDATYNEIGKTLGGVPSFIKLFPKAGVAGAWQELKGLEFSDDTILPTKTKALIGIAVAAQIPCEYCVWADTMTAKQSGATDEEIAEAVAVAALSRHWSTFFHGMQIDFDTFKRELGGEVSAK
jgi:AhpD family alkylhydroperoxidase